VAYYNACNGLHQRSVETMLNAWYYVWDRDEYQRHKEQYYSMNLKYMVWINGKARDQCEFVLPVVTVSKYRRGTQD